MLALTSALYGILEFEHNVLRIQNGSYVHIYYLVQYIAYM